MKKNQCAKADLDSYVAWQSETNQKVFEVESPGRSGSRWWHGIVPFLLAMGGIGVLGWMFFNGGAIVAIAIVAVLAENWG